MREEEEARLWAPDEATTMPSLERLLSRVRGGGARTRPYTQAPWSVSLFLRSQQGHAEQAVISPRSRRTSRRSSTPRSRPRRPSRMPANVRADCCGLLPWAAIDISFEQTASRS